MTAEEREIYGSIAEWVRDKRVRLGLTQKQLGEEARISVPSICNIERGKQRFKLGSLYRLCAVLDLEPRDILPTREELAARLNRKVQIKLGKPRRVSPETVAALEKLADKLEKKS
jgi:transcriptional regulator with XRE-family HTH domain